MRQSDSDPSQIEVDEAALRGNGPLFLADDLTWLIGLQCDSSMCPMTSEAAFSIFAFATSHSLNEEVKDRRTPLPVRSTYTYRKKGKRNKDRDHGIPVNVPPPPLNKQLFYQFARGPNIPCHPLCKYSQTLEARPSSLTTIFCRVHHLSRLASPRAKFLPPLGNENR